MLLTNYIVCNSEKLACEMEYYLETEGWVKFIIFQKNSSIFSSHSNGEFATKFTICFELKILFFTTLSCSALYFVKNYNPNWSKLLSTSSCNILNINSNCCFTFFIKENFKCTLLAFFVWNDNKS